MSTTKRVLLLQPASAGGNFEYIAIPRQGMLFLSGALAQWNGPFQYEREIWFEDRSGLIDPDKDLEGVDILMVTGADQRGSLAATRLRAKPRSFIRKSSPSAAAPR